MSIELNKRHSKTNKNKVTNKKSMYILEKFLIISHYENEKFDQ